MTADDVLRRQRQQRHQDERHDVARLGGGRRARHHDPEDGARRHGNGPGGVVVVEPGHLVEHPAQEELRRQGRHRKIEALDAQARGTEDEADAGSDDAGQQEHDDDVEIGEGRCQLVRRIGADRHEGARAEAQLSSVAEQQVEPDGRHAEDQERDQHGLEPVLARDEGHDEIRDRDQGADDPPILDDGENRLIGVVARFELSRFPVEHVRQTLSMMRSPNSPCGRNNRKTRASTYANQFSMAPPTSGPQ